jgi:ADP-ribose pyrophosphatase YjhB (NUDIX family)
VEIRTGVALFVICADRLIWLQRKSDDWANLHWHLPGGKIHPYEDAEDAIRRVSLEETGFKIPEDVPIRLLNVLSDASPEAHHITAYYCVNLDVKPPVLNTEPEKHCQLIWHRLEDYAPGPLAFPSAFKILQQLMKEYGAVGTV